MLNKIDHEKHEKLAHTILDVIHVIGEIEDEAAKKILCQNLINMCDQLKSSLILHIIKETNTEEFARL